MTLLRLNDDMVHGIFCHLDPEDLVAVTLTSSSLLSLAREHLYRQVHLTCKPHQADVADRTELFFRTLITSKATRDLIRHVKLYIYISNPDTNLINRIKGLLLMLHNVHHLEIGDITLGLHQNSTQISFHYFLET
jgi:hypothetical protein